MLLTLSLVKTSLDNHQKNIDKDAKKKQSTPHKTETRMSTVASSFALIFSLIFFTMELFVLFYAIDIAIKCSKTHSERVVNLVLASTFTIPYVMLNILFNQCAKDRLRGMGGGSGGSGENLQMDSFFKTRKY